MCLQESVTIVESAEPGEEDEEEGREGDVDTDPEQPRGGVGTGPRRLSCGAGAAESAPQFLCVPSQPITASSSAETLTDNTLTAPSTPTVPPPVHPQPG